MGNKAEKSSRKMEKLIKYGRKLKKLILLPCPRRSCDHQQQEAINSMSSSPDGGGVVHCDELFLQTSERKKGCRMIINDSDHVDPFIAAHIAAQNHFTLRPNIYI